jgi:hypothetical protein
VDALQFDRLTRVLGTPSRRGLSRTLGGLLLAGPLNLVRGFVDAEAKKKKRKKKCKGGKKKCGKQCIAVTSCCAAADCGACESCQGGACVLACQAGQACVGGQCQCTTTSCDGCCDGSTCRDGDTSDFCGSDGEICAVCPGNQACQNGTCCGAQGSPCALGAGNGCCSATCLGTCSPGIGVCTSDDQCLGEGDVCIEGACT